MRACYGHSPAPRVASANFFCTSRTGRKTFDKKAGSWSVLPGSLRLMWGSFKAIISSAPQPPPQAAVPANRRTKRANDVSQDAKALQKTQRMALGDISNRAEAAQQPAKRTTRAAQPTKPASEAPMIPAPPVPKMTTVYPTAAQIVPAIVVVHVEPSLVSEAGFVG